MIVHVHKHLVCFQRGRNSSYAKMVVLLEQVMRVIPDASECDLSTKARSFGVI